MLIHCLSDKLYFLAHPKYIKLLINNYSKNLGEIEQLKAKVTTLSESIEKLQKKLSKTHEEREAAKQSLKSALSEKEATELNNVRLTRFLSFLYIYS